MRIVIAAVGKFRHGPERQLYDSYIERLSWPVTLVEVELRGRLPDARRKAAEAEKLLGAVTEGATLIALDEHGSELTSQAFATRIGRWRDDGVRDLAFAIGGADGLDRSVLDRADLALALGRLTWPHMMARAMLAEQLYRASTILSGHPYHRD